MKKFSWSAAILICTIVLTGCETEPAGPVDSINFSKDILPVFTKNCNFPGCHNQVDAQSGIDLTTWASLMLKGSNFGAEIVPFNSRWSHLIQHIHRDTVVSPFSDPLMPLAFPPYSNGQPLSRSTVEQVIAWVQEGARNDNGEIAFNNVTRKVLVTNQASDLVAVVNLQNNFIIRYVKVGTGGNTLAAPHNITADSQGKYFYVTLIREGYVEKFDVGSYEKLGRQNIVSSPGHVVVTPDGKKGYVTNYDLSSNERFIRSFDTENLSIINTISDITMNATHGARITHDGAYLVTVSLIGEYVQIIRTQDDAVEATIPVAANVPPTGNGTNLYQPIAVSLSRDDRYAYITCTRSHDVRILDLQTRTITGIIPVGLFPIQSECSSDGRWLYVANRNSNSVTVIDLNTNTVFRTIPDVGAQPHGVSFTKDGHYAYVSCESVSGTFVHHPSVGSSNPGTTAVIDVWNGHVKVKDIEMASYPAGITITE